MFIIYACLLLLLLCGSRASFRLIGEFARRRSTGLRLVIYGAWEVGALLLSELLRSPDEQYRMLGFVDDDPATHNLRLQGYPVIGGENRLFDMIRAAEVDVIVIGSTRLPEERLDRLEAACRLQNIAVLRFTFKLEPLETSG